MCGAEQHIREQNYVSAGPRVQNKRMNDATFNRSDANIQTTHSEVQNKVLTANMQDNCARLKAGKYKVVQQR